MNLGVYLYLLLAGAVSALLLVPPFKYLSIRLGVVDVPRPGRIHSRATPLLGGPPIFLGMLLVVGGHLLAGQVLAHTELARRWLSPEVIAQMHRSVGALGRLAAIFAGALVILAVGVADDVRSLPVAVRLGTELAVAALIVHFGLRPRLHPLPEWLVRALATLWIVGITNAFNLIDSMDGLAAGVAAIAAALLGFWAALSHQPMVAALLAAFTGVLIGFLYFNSSPAGIFLGSSGSMLLGYFLSVTVLVCTYVTHLEAGLLPVVMPVLILGIPLYDTASVVAIRLWRRRSPFSPDLNHLAHRLHRLGLSRRRAVLLIYLMTLAVGLNAVLLATGPVLSRYFEATVILAQVLAVFGVIVVLEMVSFGGRSVRLATPVAGGFEPGAGEPGTRLAGQVTRLSLGGAELELAELGAELAGRLLAAREPGRMTLGFQAPFEPTVLAAAVRGAERTRSGGWRLSLDFGALDEEARRRLGFALEHYRALGER